MKKLSLKKYWSNDKFLETPIFHKIMSRDRFMVLLQMIYFNDNNFKSEDPLIK
jgi:hypothetical protein